MTNTSQGDGWWEASNHKWYPPELHNDAAHRARYAKSPEPPKPDVTTDAEPPESGSTSDVTTDPEPPESGFKSEAPTSPEPVFEPIPPSRPLSTPPAEAPRKPRGPAHASTTLDPLADGPRRSLLTNPWLWFTVLALAITTLVAISIVSIFGGDSNDGETGVTTSDSANGDDSNNGPTAPVPKDPVAFGQVHQWEGWRATVIDVLDADAEGLLATFTDPPTDGNVFVAAIYEVMYTGTETTEFEPFIVTASSADALEPFACFFDGAALSAIGVETFVFELVPGQTARLAECFEVPDSQVDDVVVTIENVAEFDSAVVFARDGDSLRELAPVTVAPDYSDLVAQPFGFVQTWEDWEGSITEVVDAEADELVSDFSDPAREGFTYMAVITEITYSGDEPSDFNPVQVAALGSGVFDAFSNCILSTDLLAARGVESAFEFEPGQTAIVAQCVEVPDDELDSVLYRMVNTFDFEAERVYYTAA